MTDDEMTANNCSLVNIINQGEGKKFVYRVHVAAMEEKKETAKGKKKDKKQTQKKEQDGKKKRKLAAVAKKPVMSSKKGKKKESATCISIDNLRKKFKSFSKHVQKEVVQLMGGHVNSRGGSNHVCTAVQTNS